ncbi:hypothetical protein MJO29_008587 [Puccinia striiformis f. sp. tritici]|nr:hypothetical protein MJO29_007934 [Puccinia striiformis f. sp. tritici]KAI7952956.1 hypothetical protein MJO29_008587 [Puccinia striiformis f. sp. tritici]
MDDEREAASRDEQLLGSYDGIDPASVNALWAIPEDFPSDEDANRTTMPPLTLAHRYRRSHHNSSSCFSPSPPYPTTTTSPFSSLTHFEGTCHQNTPIPQQL